MIDRLRLHPGEDREAIRSELRDIGFIETSASVRATYLRLGSHPALVAGMIAACRECADMLERKHPTANKEPKR